MIDQSKIDWLLNGEEVEADILNRPLRQMLAEVNTEFSTTTDSVESKVDKQPGKGLSDANFTQAEKDKLSTLESSKFVGLFVSESALPSTGSEGDYANVDGGVGSDVYRVIWDTNDNKWVRIKGVSTELTPSQIKQQYESNPDTNAFTDDEKAKLSSVATGATANRADSANADKVHTHTTSQVTGLDAALNAKAPTSHTHTWTQITGQPVTATRWPSAGEVTGLGTAATRDVGESSGNVMRVGAFGLGGNMVNPPSSPLGHSNPTGVYYGPNEPGGMFFLDVRYIDTIAGFRISNKPYTNVFYLHGALGGSLELRPPVIISHSGNLLNTTGQSTEYPMSQKAVTDALNATSSSIKYSTWTTDTTINNDHDSFLISTPVTTITVPVGLTRDVILVSFKKVVGGTENLTFTGDIDIGNTDTTVREGETTSFSLVRLDGSLHKLVRLGSGYSV